MVLFIISVIVFIFILNIYVHRKIEKVQNKPPQQPIHFELLDENGNPFKFENRDVEVEVEVLRYFCIKDKGYHVSVWPKDSGNWLPDLDYVEFNIAGITFQPDIEDYIGEHVGMLEAEPDNEYDPNAIKILAEDGHQVGYVPKDQTKFVREFGSLPRVCYFYIGEYQDSGGYFTDCYITTNNP